MTMFMQKAAVVTLVFLGSAQAAQDGGLGNLSGGGSQGEFKVTMDLKGVTRIFGLKDMEVTPSDLSPKQNFCIYSNTDNFTINVTSGQNFELRDGSQTVGATYSLELFNDKDASGTAAKKWDAGSASSADASIPKKGLAVTDDETTGQCGTGNFSLKINAALKKGVKEGMYSDTVTLLVTPE